MIEIYHELITQAEEAAKNEQALVVSRDRQICIESSQHGYVKITLYPHPKRSDLSRALWDYCQPRSHPGSITIGHVQTVPWEVINYRPL